MNADWNTNRITDELERKLIQLELDEGPRRDPEQTSVSLLQIVVGTLLLVGMLVLAAHFG